MLITSASNPKIVAVAKLADKKYRRQSGQYVIEGVRLVSDAIRHGAMPSGVFVKESVASSFDYPNQTVVSDAVFDKLADTVNSQGVLAVVDIPNQPLTAPSGNCLILDGLQDPGNVGTLIRTAAATGFGDVFAVSSADLYSPKVLRSAMSAHFCVRLHQTDDMPQLLNLLQGFDVVAADMSGEDVFSAQLGGKVALVLGNEGNGLSQFCREHVAHKVSLPMANDFESLNVAVAGSVIMYRIFSQNKFRR